MRRHVGIGAVDQRFIEAGTGNSGAQIVADDAGGGGGGLYNGEYYGGSPGCNGGGAVVFSSPGNITLTSTAVLNAAGGAVWLFAPESVSNAGQILASGGLGSAILLPESSCANRPLVKGPDGGNGSGGVLYIASPAVANSGTINLSGGNGAATPNRGLLNGNGVTINNTGSIIGAAKTE
jgi:hypothetical protein